MSPCYSIIVSLPLILHNDVVIPVFTGIEIKPKLLCQALIKFYLLFDVYVSVLSVMFSSERRDHEGNVEVHGQDEVLQETIHLPFPRLSHRLSALFQPLYG